MVFTLMVDDVRYLRQLRKTKYRDGSKRWASLSGGLVSVINANQRSSPCSIPILRSRRVHECDESLYRWVVTVSFHASL